MDPPVWQLPFIQFVHFSNKAYIGMEVDAKNIQALSPDLYQVHDKTRKPSLRHFS